MKAMKPYHKFRSSGYFLDAVILKEYEEGAELPKWFTDKLFECELMLAKGKVILFRENKVISILDADSAVVTLDDFGNVNLIPYAFFDHQYHPAN